MHVIDQTNYLKVSATAIDQIFVCHILDPFLISMHAYFIHRFLAINFQSRSISNLEIQFELGGTFSSRSEDVLICD